MAVYEQTEASRPEPVPTDGRHRGCLRSDELNTWSGAKNRPSVGVSDAGNRSSTPVRIHAAPQQYGGGNTGFTLIELLITLSVAAILLAVAVPNLRVFVQNSRINTAADGLLTAIQRARSEAIARGDVVALCRTGDASAKKCKANDPDGNPNQDREWTYGWLSYVIDNYSGERDYNSSTDTLVALGTRAPNGVFITSDSNGNNWLTIGQDGTLNETAAAAYAVCDSRGVSKGKLVVVPLIGMPYITDDMSAAPNCKPNG